MCTDLTYESFEGPSLTYNIIEIWRLVSQKKESFCWWFWEGMAGSIKVQIFWEGHKNLTYLLHCVLPLLSGRWAKFLWPSQNIWILTYFNEALLVIVNAIIIGLAAFKIASLLSLVKSSSSLFRNLTNWFNTLKKWTSLIAHQVVNQPKST